MKITFLFAAALFAATSAFAAAPTEYQVTGAVTAMTDTVITVQKGKEIFECARNADTKMTGGDPKVGDKVTVHYSITATAVENKGVAPAKKPASASPAPAASPAKP